MDNTVVYPPNKVLERVVNFSQNPVVYNNLLYIDFNENGESILGCANFGTLWEGTLLHFKTDALLTFNFDKTYVSSTSSNAKFLNNDTVVLGEDSGVLNILSTTSDAYYFESVQYFRHIDPILSLAVWGSNSNVLTSSGTVVSIWDVKSNTRTPIHQFTNIHTELINSVDTIKSELDLFLTASTDRKCCIWDIRLEVPASVIYSNEFCALTSVACHQNDPNFAVVGTEGGDLYFVDKRQPKEFLSTFSNNDKIHRIAYNNNKFAICGDGNQIQVVECQNEILTEIYTNDEHIGIVRGLAWFNDALYSCGFDKKVLKHIIS